MGVLAAGILAGADALAQTPLTLADAMRRARTTTAAARALAAADNEAAERVRQARAGFLPRVDVTESVQRGDQPVYVFSSLLSQRRFTAANFAIDALNHPSPVTNARTGVMVEQSLYDGGLTRLAVKGAEISRDIVAATSAGAQQDLALGSARAFVRVLQLESAARASQAAVEAAESDLARARARRDVGLVTDADVLDVEVHLADMRQRALGTTADLAVARIQLNEIIGAPLDEVVTIVAPGAPPAFPSVEALIGEALSSRPDHREADLRTTLAANARGTAQAAFFPRVGLQGGWEFNGQRFTEQRASWIVGAQVQINLFRGFGDAARAAEARHAELRAQAEREGVDRAIEVGVRAAAARLDAARARERVGQAALMQARESQRIVRDRYDGGLATIGDVLRAASAVLEVESRATAAQMDVIVQAVELDRAAGRL
ncbi:MAG TPA: TolC family protein [Vicinamibacterales bacterium]|nr:TolC family protein [Vicinamibacterales bacterium]